MTPVYRRGDVLVPLDRNPLEVYLLVLCLVTGAAGLLGYSPNPPSAFDWVWYSLLVWGGGGVLIGSAMRDAINGVLLVRASLFPAGFGAYVYGLIVGFRGDWLAALFIVGFGFACHCRVWQITRHLRLERQRT